MRQTSTQNAFKLNSHVGSGTGTGFATSVDYNQISVHVPGVIVLQETYSGFLECRVDVDGPTKQCYENYEHQKNKIEDERIIRVDNGEKNVVLPGDYGFYGTFFNVH